MFIGCRGTVVVVDPTGRDLVSLEASDAVYAMPVAANAGARNGLSMVCCGRTVSPECSPVTSCDLSNVVR